jgi:hypothetical protein
MKVGKRVSLEMDPEGLDAVRAFVERTYPDARISFAGTYERVRFGGCDFLHENEFDEPYLLAQAPKGDQVLTAVANHFS